MQRRNPKKREILAGKIAQIDAGDTNVTFDPLEFVLYVLHRQDGPTEEALSKKLGYHEDYISGTFHNWRAQISPYVAEKLAYLSGTSPDVWKKESYTPQDAEGIRFDMSKDSAVEIAKPITGSHLKRLRRIADKEPFDGTGIA